MTISFTLNGSPFRYDGDPEKPLLWVLREDAELAGTKYGCGIAACGACTVHVDGAATRCCSVLVGDVAGSAVVTIEGLGKPNAPHPAQQAWIDSRVPQCGYCQSGMIMAAAALLAENPNPTDADIDAAMTNICRCGTYPRVRAAIHQAATGRQQL
jgi:isoquinoline 1-oxidoreductase alpha subunit